MIIGGLNIASGIIIATFAAWVATNTDLLADAINDSLMMRTKDVSKGEQSSDKAVIAKQLTNSFPEMQKVADAADISVLFFSAGAKFWSILVIFGPFWQFWVIFEPIWAILGNFWAILGNFRSFFGANFFVAKYASVLFKSLFATLPIWPE